MTTSPRKLASVPLSPTLYQAGVTVYSMTMTVPEFIGVPRCPVQRNEALRVNKPHLRTLVPTHSVVAIAVLPDGTICKVDGHSRALKWAEGSLEHPAQLIVQVYPVKTLDEVEAVYDAYDGRGAVKSGTDMVQSAFAKFDLDLKTPWLAAGGATSAMELACLIIGKGKPPKKEQVELFAREMELFDSIGPTKSNFIIGIAAGALLLLRKHGTLGLDFLKRYDGNLGNKIGEDKDAAQMLTDFLKAERAAGTNGGIVNNRRHAAMTLALHTRHVGGKMHKRLPRPVDLASYIPA